jgi:hypothetical protein
MWQPHAVKRGGGKSELSTTVRGSISAAKNPRLGDETTVHVDSSLRSDSTASSLSFATVVACGLILHGSTRLRKNSKLSPDAMQRSLQQYPKREEKAVE